jgi:uncharacterized protein
MKVLLRIVSLLLPCVAAAQSTEKICPPPLPQPTNAQWIEKSKVAKNSGFLWRIEKDSRTSWLYGTIHVNSLELAMPGPMIVSAIKEVDTVVLELDLSTPEKVNALAAEVMKPAPQGKPLETKTIERIKKYLNSLCLPVDNFLKFPPAVLQVALSTQSLRHKGIYPEFMVDAFIGGFGTGLKKQVIALESAQLQMKALDSSTESASTDKDLDETLRSLEMGEAQKVTQEIFDVWARGDLIRFEQFPDWCDCMRTSEERQQMTRLNDDRNVNMAKQIVQMLNNSKRLFIAVGSLHMIGAKGLPTLLREQGFTVTRVALTGE